MWKVLIECSAEAWKTHAVAFKAMVERYPVTLLASKKMRADEYRIMEYQLDEINDVEALIEECLTLSGFTATFESL